MIPSSSSASKRPRSGWNSFGSMIPDSRCRVGTALQLREKFRGENTNHKKNYLVVYPTDRKWVTTLVIYIYITILSHSDTVTWWFIPRIVSGLVHPSYKWTTCPHLSHWNHQGCNPLTICGMSHTKLCIAGEWCVFSYLASWWFTDC